MTPPLFLPASLQHEIDAYVPPASGQPVNFRSRHRPFPRRLPLDAFYGRLDAGEAGRVPNYGGHGADPGNPGRIRRSRRPGPPPAGSIPTCGYGPGAGPMARGPGHLIDGEPAPGVALVRGRPPVPEGLGVRMQGDPHLDLLNLQLPPP